MSMELYFAPSYAFTGTLTGDVLEAEIIVGKPVVVLSEFSVGPPASFDNLAAAISDDPNNSLEMGDDGKLFVENPTEPDPLPYYILAKG